MNNTEHSKLLIIGSGPAGYTAAIYGARAMLKPILFQGIQPGGQLTITTEVENWPGEKVIMGPDLMKNLEGHAISTGVKVIQDHIKKLNLKKYPFLVEGENNKHFTAETIILATGATAKWLGLESEDYFKGFGVSACATCDGFFYKNEEIVVVGGGNTAVEEALFLTNFASKVTLIHRRNNLRAEKILQNRLFKNKKIEIIWESEIIEVLGKKNPKSVEEVLIKNVKDSSLKKINCKGLFVAIGHSPASELVKDQLKLFEGGYVFTKPDSTQTSIPGVFAAGDITDSKYRQAITSAGMGCMAALEAEKFLSEKE